MELFIQMGIMIILASVMALILNNLKVPPIISYIIAGMLAGLFGLRPESEIVHVMVEFGIILLLFLAGLEIKLKELFQLGRKTILIGEGHDIIMAIFGFVLAYFVLGLDTLASFYLAIGITLSSTIVVVKALTSRKELAAPHGKILIGTMVLQDIIAMVSLGVFSSIGKESSILMSVASMFWKGFLIFIILMLIGRKIIPNIFKYASESLELVFLIALGWAFTGVALAGLAGFSTSIGAFLAGLAISDLPFSFEINDKAKGLRDFGILLFFLSVGLQLQITKAILTNWKLYLLIVFVLAFTPLITSLITGFLRFTKKEIFVMSMLPMQTSEFTLILVTFGFTAGHLTSEIYTIITLVIVTTIMISSIIADNLNRLYKKVEHKIDFIEWKHAEYPLHLKSDLKKHIIIFGYGKLGQNISDFFRKQKKQVIVVDWRPEMIKIAHQHKCMIVYGDAGDSDLWEEVKIEKASTVISTIGENQEDDINLLKYLKKHNPKALKIFENNHVKGAKQLYNLGADIVLVHDNLEWNDLELYLKNPSKKTKKVFEVK